MAGIQQAGPVIDRLIALGVTGEREEARGDDRALQGMIIVVTGTMSGTKLDGYARDDMEELIERHGARASATVSSVTSLVVAGARAGAKLARARALGIRVVTPDEFAAMIGM